MLELNFDTGLVEMSVNGVRTIRINPADVGFFETLYNLMGKVDAIEAETAKKREKTEDPAKLFDYYRFSDKKMREAVDSVFGEGFCADVFKDIRLVAITSNGMTALEGFLFAVIDQMDESVKGSMEKRSDTISKYTSKYQQYHKK